MDFKSMETSEILGFLNFFRKASQRIDKENDYRCALNELEKRSKLMAMLYK